MRQIVSILILYASVHAGMAFAGEADALGHDGYVVGSMSFNGRYPEGEKIARIGGKANFRCKFYALAFRSTETAPRKVKGNLRAIPKGGRDWDEETERDFELADGLGYIFAEKLPPGDYIIIQDSAKCGNRTYYVPGGTRIPFTVKPGTVTYLGELRYQHRFRENFLGSMAPAAPDLVFLDAADRDLPLIYSRYPNLEALPVESVILSWPPRPAGEDAAGG